MTNSPTRYDNVTLSFTCCRCKSSVEENVTESCPNCGGCVIARYEYSHSPEYKFAVEIKASEYEGWTPSGEGPFVTREDAEDFISYECGVPARVVEL